MASSTDSEPSSVDSDESRSKRREKRLKSSSKDSDYSRLKKKAHKRRKSSSSDSESSYESSDCKSTKKSKRRKSSKMSEECQKIKKKKKDKKKSSKKMKKREKSKNKHIPEQGQPSQHDEGNCDIPINLMDRSSAMAPMTKEEWDKRQGVVRRVYDETTGRNRLIKGDGEVIEEIVSRDRHKAINQQATLGDGNFFQSQMSNHLKK